MKTYVYNANPEGEREGRVDGKKRRWQGEERASEDSLYREGKGAEEETEVCFRFLLLFFEGRELGWRGYM